MYAVIKTGGKQYKVKEGDVITVEKIKKQAGEKVVFDEVLMIGEGKKIEIGTPYLDAAKVYGYVVENGKGDKVIIYKYKAKKDYRKKQGHRQPYSMVEITGINEDKPRPEKKEEPEKTEAAAKPKKAGKSSAKPAGKAAEAKKAKDKKPADKSAEKKAADKSAEKKAGSAKKQAPKMKPKTEAMKKETQKEEKKQEKKQETVKENKAPSLKSMKKDELVAFAKENNIKIDEKATKPVIIEAIEKDLK